MNKLLVLLLALTFSISGFSQKVKFKDDIALVDGVPFLNFVYTLSEGTMSISSLKAPQEEIFATYLSYNDPANQNRSDPNGAVSWIEFNFLTLGLKCEVPYKTRKMVVKFIIAQKLYVSGVLNLDNVNLLITKYVNIHATTCPLLDCFQIRTSSHRKTVKT